MHRDAIAYTRLMQESTNYVQAAAYRENSREQAVAARLLADTTAWERWEAEHSGLMRKVAGLGQLAEQRAALKVTNFQLIHRKALFEYLRDNEVRGVERPRILAHFRMALHYEHAVIAEHRVYVRKACSFFCTGHLGLEVLRDAGFSDPMLRYEELYAEYFELYCRVNCADPDAAPDPRRALLPLLKHQLNEWRRAILHPRAELPRLLREAELRRPTGETQKNRILPWPRDDD
jgi:hypothetical protein